MPVTPDLPPLRDGLRLPVVAAGVWTAEEVSLNGLAEALNIDAALGDASALKSIPDAWAQVQIARHALTAHALDRRHAAGEAVTREWRALLALFALAPLYRTRYELKVDAYDLPPAPAQGAATPASKAFAAVLATLPPTAMLHPAQAGWSRLGFLWVRSLGQGMAAEPAMVGLLTPDLLVSPTRLTAGARLPGVPWFEAGPQDPTQVQGLNARDYALLALYLHQLRADLRAQAAFASDDQHIDGMLSALDRYRADCAALAGAIELATTPRTLAAISPPTDLHAKLLRTFEIDPARIAITEGPCHLKLRERVLEQAAGGREAAFHGVVLLDPAVASARGSTPDRVFAWRHHLLSEVGDSRVLQTVRDDAAAAGYLAVTADDLFCADFINLEAGSDIGGHDLQHFRDALLPLSPLALLIFEPADILKAISVEHGGAGERFVSLTLPLQDGAVVTLQRAYRRGAEVSAAWSDVIRPSGLAVWPNFRHPNWPWNFLRFEHDPSGSDLQTRFGASGAQIARDILELDDMRQCEARARQWASQTRCEVEGRILAGAMTKPGSGPIQPLQRLRFVDQADSVGEIQISERGFEALFFARRPGKSGPVRPAGMILLTTDAPASRRPESPVVAVDFGSTNTVAATDVALDLDDETRRELGLGPGAPEALVFSARRTRFPVGAGEPGRQREHRASLGWSQIDFFPLIAQPTPAPTVLHLRELSGDKTPSHAALKSDKRPLFPDSIFFLTGFDTGTKLERRVSGIMIDHRENLVFNLKWGRDPDFTEHFLRQFVIMSAAELAARGYEPSAIRWRFSYPEAMHPDNVQYLKTTYQNFADTLFPPPPDGLPPAPVEAVTEGEAAATYFLSKNIRGLTVLLDIGGSTTDVAVWRSGGTDQLIWHGSVRIAGGDFMTHYLVNNPAFLKALNMEEVDEVLGKAAQQKSQLLAPRVDGGAPTLRDMAELFFSDERFRPRFQEAYRREAASGLGQGLRHSAMAAVGGVLYYVGKVLGELAREAPELLDELGNVNIAFAGRGALFLSELGGSDPVHSAKLQGLAAVMARAAGLKPPYRRATPLFSPEPKLEAVLGMSRFALRSFERPSDRRASDFLPLGEVVPVKGEPPLAPWDNVRALLGRERVGEPKLTEFEAFLDALAEEAGVAIELGEAEPGKARQEILSYVTRRLNEDFRADRIADGRLKAHQTTDVEPVFISALRALLECLGQDAATRARLLSVAEAAR